LVLEGLTTEVRPLLNATELVPEVDVPPLLLLLLLLLLLQAPIPSAATTLTAMVAMILRLFIWWNASCTHSHQAAL
jgi:hypothetical protein